MANGSQEWLWRADFDNALRVRSFVCAAIAVLLSVLIFLGFSFVDGFDSTAEVIGGITGSATGFLLLYLTLRSQLRPSVSLFCHHCGKHTSSDEPWVCGYCDEENSRKSFMDACGRCGRSPTAYQCHHCGMLCPTANVHDGRHPARKVGFKPPTPPAKLSGFDAERERIKQEIELNGLLTKKAKTIANRRDAEMKAHPWMRPPEPDPVEAHLKMMEESIRLVAAEDELLDHELTEYREKCTARGVPAEEIRARLARLKAAGIRVTRK